MLIVMKHACPAYGPDAPPEQWLLGDDGHEAARSLALALPSGALLASSVEPKARQTLEPAGTVSTDERFNEVWRDEPYEGDFRARRSAYVAGADHPGWEPRADVAARFASGIAHWTSAAGDRPLVIASHGMALTIWLTEAIGLDDPEAFWLGLTMPDPHIVDLAARTVTRLESPDLIRVQ